MDKKSIEPPDASEKIVDLLSQILLGRQQSAPVYYDSTDVKQMLKISERTLCRLRANGDIEYVRLGGKYYYPGDLLSKAVRKRKRKN